MAKGVRQEVTRQALWRINHALAQGTDAVKAAAVARHGDVMDLYADSAAYSLCQNVLGMSNVRSPSCGRIRVAFPAERSVSEFAAVRVDDEAAAFSLGVRVALSAQLFRFYDASHCPAKDDKERVVVEWAVQRGDVVLFHPLLCLAGEAASATEHIEYSVDFCVRHAKWDKQVALRRAEHLWIGFEKMASALHGEMLKI